MLTERSKTHQMLTATGIVGVAVIAFVYPSAVPVLMLVVAVIELTWHLGRRRLPRRRSKNSPRSSKLSLSIKLELERRR